MYKVYANRDNTFAVELIKNDVTLTVAEMGAITKVGLMFNGTEYHSGTYASAFDWATRDTEGVVIFQLGEVLTTEARDNKAEIFIYTASDLNGVVWTTIDVKVIVLT